MGSTHKAFLVNTEGYCLKGKHLCDYLGCLLEHFFFKSTTDKHYDYSDLDIWYSLSCEFKTGTYHFKENN